MTIRFHQRRFGFAGRSIGSTVLMTERPMTSRKRKRRRRAGPSLTLPARRTHQVLDYTLAGARGMVFPTRCGLRSWYDMPFVGQPFQADDADDLGKASQARKPDLRRRPCAMQDCAAVFLSVR